MTVELVAAPDGARFAHRMQGGPWRPVWLGKHDLILAADKGRLAMPVIDWSRVPTSPSPPRTCFGTRRTNGSASSPSSRSRS